MLVPQSVDGGTLQSWNSYIQGILWLALRIWEKNLVTGTSCCCPGEEPLAGVIFQEWKAKQEGSTPLSLHYSNLFLAPPQVEFNKNLGSRGELWFSELQPQHGKTELRVH